MTPSEKWASEESTPKYTLEEMNVAPLRESIKNQLSRLELEEYENWRLEFARWAFYCGKEPEDYEGFAPSSMKNIVSRVDTFAEEVFAREGFTTEFTEEHLDGYWHLIRQQKRDCLVDSKRRLINDVSLVLKHRGISWKIPNSEKTYRRIAKESGAGFPDWHTTKELNGLRRAALRLYSVPRQRELSSEERDRWAAQLAQLLEKPKHELTEKDWEFANSWKIPSLVYVSRDVGFRPSEVGNAKMSWLVLDEEDDAYIKVPKQEDAKSGKNYWRCFLSSETARITRKWVDERAARPEYEGREEIWLNGRNETPYNSKSLRDIMLKLQPEAGINPEHRENGWYMIRRGVGTEIGNAEGIHALKAQLRIKRTDTALRYIQTDEPSIRRWLKER
ncbi:hypothetical protein [Halorubrum distributum]|uniref:Tyrosine-type recombinase/integrase n=1 Tax=Halorubrum distributum TaxID=29283 RepID=A0A6B1ISW2_9EURY|nr:hypothetical protein [Halorubrum terrestre]MYL66631.1 hypothetical protein [Halorubrum terrestre]